MNEFTGPSANYIRQQVTIALGALAPLEKLGTDVATQGLLAVIEECRRRVSALPPEAESSSSVTMGSVLATVAKTTGNMKAPL